MRRLSVSLCVLSLTALTLLSGCGVVGRTPPSTYYVLNAGTEPELVNIRVTGPRVAVGPLTLPGYLDRTAILVRPSGDPASPQVEIRELSVWSEPLGDGMVRLLCDGLSRRLKAHDGLAFPLQASIPATWRLSVDVARFDGALGGAVVLDVGWTLATSLGEVQAMGRFSRSIAAGQDMADMVLAQSRLLDQFSEVLAEEIMQAEKTTQGE